MRSLENHPSRSEEESKVEKKIMRKSKGWVFLGFNMGFIVLLYLDSDKHLVIPCLYFLLYWSRLFCGVSFVG